MADRSTARRVLIIDDNVDLAAMLSLMIESFGHTTAVAHDGQAGVELATKFLPDVVLLDLIMPQMSGYEVAAALRNIPGRQDVRLISMSGWDNLHSTRLAEKLGFYGQLTKPLQMQELKELIEA